MDVGFREESKVYLGDERGREGKGRGRGLCGYEFGRVGRLNLYPKARLDLLTYLPTHAHKPVGVGPTLPKSINKGSDTTWTTRNPFFL